MTAKKTEQPPVGDGASSPVYIANDVIRHNNKMYKSGSVVDDLTDDQAVALLTAGVLVVGQDLA